MKSAQVFRVDDRYTNKNKNNDEISVKGIWIGIDLGTSTTTVAVWDIHKQRSKLLRFPSTLAPPIERNGKLGRCVPSAVLFAKHSRGEIKDSSANIFVGYDAVKRVDEENFQHMNGSVLITSAKRIWGMTYAQIKDELGKDPEFLERLPFECRLVDNGVSSEGLKIRISQQSQNDEIEPDYFNVPIDEWIDPLDIARLILSSMRNAAKEYIYKQRRNLHVLGTPISDEKDLFDIQNCVLATPAHYSRIQRRFIVEAAKKAGFQRVETIIESTAAALSYGLFVSPKLSLSSNEIQFNSNATTPTFEAKTIIVFDMGAGTTDVTIISMNIDPKDDDAKFRVIATAGDKYLGGDDMDAALAKFVLQELEMENLPCTSLDNLNYKDNLALQRLCRKAKEELCGNDSWKDTREPKSSVMVSWKGHNIEIHQVDFCKIIQPLVNRVHRVFDDAFMTIDSKLSVVVDEVVVVGGASKTPSIREMLRSRFPPPHPPELCCSIKGEAAVAQGAAIQSALVSNLVPKYELRNAMMLDALPHTIGILINPASSDGDENIVEEYVPIIPKNSPLPSKGSSRFTLANVRQRGISVTIVEDVGEDYPLQRIGQFDFLLHRLLENEIKEKCPLGIRQVDIEVSANNDGSLTISYFDENDPDHLRRRKISPQSTTDIHPKSGEELLLIVGCIFFFLLYVGTKLIFNKVEVDL